MRGYVIEFYQDELSMSGRHYHFPHGKGDIVEERKMMCTQGLRDYD